MGIGYSEGVVKRGMTLERFADITSTNAARIFGLYPRKGAIAAGSDADLVFIDPAVRKTLTRDDFHVTDYSPWEGWDGVGLAGDDDAARQGDRRARQAARQPERRPPAHAPRSIRSSCSARPAEGPSRPP